jgi:hypothetical protein
MKENDWLTVAAIGVLAMCLVTFDHETLGHGGACLALHGHILALSSSVFSCSARSGLIDAAGPLTNILCGLIAWAIRGAMPQRAIKTRLLLGMVTAFSLFWDGGYLIHAMHRQDGDLYSFAQWWLGTVTIWQRVVGAVLGLALYLLSVWLTARALLDLCPDAKKARSVARIVWLSATIGAALAAWVYTGGVERDLRDAVEEIGIASFPLLFLPIRNRLSSEGHPAAAITRSYGVIILAAAVYATFVLTLGRGFS